MSIARTLAVFIVGAAVGAAAYWKWVAPPSTASSSPAAGGLWTCGMHPQIIQDHPGDCPICRMKLTPRRGDGESDATSGRLAIDPTIVQNMGVRTALVQDGPLRRSIKAFGVVEEAATGIRDINLRVSGWVSKLHVISEGSLVEAGSPLFDLYSPELRLAVDELIAARRATASRAPGAESLFEAATRRVTLLGLDQGQIDSLSKLERAPETVTFTSPVAGSVVDKPIVEGSSIAAGDRALRIVDHSAVWIEAKVFEQDLPFVKLSAKASAVVQSRPRNTYKGDITFIHPHVDPVTRAATVRLEVRNPGLALKPGMFATVSITSEVAERAILVPKEAVIDTGDESVVMVSLGGGKFEPRVIKTGLSGDGGVLQVVSGLAAGEAVVTSGQFLLDSESRAKQAMQKFLGGSPTTDSSVPGPRLEVTAAQQERIDQVASAYFAVCEALGAEQTDAKPIECTALIEAARALSAAAGTSAISNIAGRVLQTSEAMRGIDLDKQREAFKQVSQAMIALVDASPPGATVAKTVYIMHCPMTAAPGDWLQDNDEMANPYYATDMKSCGETVRTIPPGAHP